MARASSAVSTRHRLHVGGLGPSVTKADLERRFSSFGTVVAVEGAGKLDANGVPLRYAFVELDAEETQIQRCMNLLSGTTYHGAVLRIAPARPDYAARLARERAGLPSTSLTSPDEADEARMKEVELHRRMKKLRKIGKRKRGIEGHEAEDMQVMTRARLQMVGEGSGWKKDPVTGLPIFPIVARPLRPLPSLAKAPNLDDDDDLTASARPPNRARRIRIDPTQYNPPASSSFAKGKAAPSAPKRHLVGAREVTTELYRLGYGGGAKAGRVGAGVRNWRCDETDGKLVWVLNDGEGEEVVPLPRLARSKASTAGPVRSLSPVRSIVPRQLRHPTPPPQASVASASDITAQVSAERRAQLALLASLGSTSEDALEDVHEGLRAAVERQKARETDAGDGTTWMEDAGIEIVASDLALGPTRTYDSDESEADGANVLRLRGGGPKKTLIKVAAPSSSDDSDDSDDISDDDSDDSSSSSTVAATAPPAVSASSSATLDHPTASSSTDEDIPASQLIVPSSNAGQRSAAEASGTKLQMKSLTSMFEAQPESTKGGFTLFGEDEGNLFGGMDLDLGEDPLAADDDDAAMADEPGPGPSTTKTAPIHPSRLAALRTGQPDKGTKQAAPLLPSAPADQEPLFFSYPYDDAEYEEGGFLNSLGIKKGDARDQDLRRRCRFHAIPGGKELLGWKAFYRTQSIDEITKAHEEKRTQLTQQFKKRRREALRSSRKR